ncbi:MAG TPA: hypothetical protein VLL52_02960 [Anaerolineae bacterium]|nr:hypothetical protein [Anaerolineae bacterium]
MQRRLFFKWLMLLLVVMGSGAVAYAFADWGSPVTVNSQNPRQNSLSTAMVDGRPAVSYGYFVTSSSYGLRYIRADNVDGSSWGTPVDVYLNETVVDETSLEVVDGNPAIAFRHEVADELQFVRANDAQGDSWGVPITLASLGANGGYLSLAIVNGNPAISYYIEGSGLWYMRANDAQGSSWGAAVQVDAGGNTGYTDMIVVNGNPAIAYRNSAQQTAYKRALDINGTSWPAGTVLIDNRTAQGVFLSLAIVNNFPAISYYNSLMLNYTRANDINGDSWGSYQVLGSTVGYGNTLIVNDANNPIIAYHGSDGVYYRESSDINGSSWLPSEMAASSFGVSKGPGLLMVTGQPAVAYYNSSTSSIMYIRAGEPSAVTIDQMQTSRSWPVTAPVLVCLLALLTIIVVGARLKVGNESYNKVV